MKLWFDKYLKDLKLKITHDPHSSNFVLKITYIHLKSFTTFWWWLDIADDYLEIQTQYSYLATFKAHWIQNIMTHHI